LFPVRFESSCLPRPRGPFDRTGGGPHRAVSICGLTRDENEYNKGDWMTEKESL
jgi:hypothetical protein